MTGTGGISGEFETLDGRQDVSVVGEIVISVSSGFVRGSVSDSGSRDVTGAGQRAHTHSMQRETRNAKE